MEAINRAMVAFRNGSISKEMLDEIIADEMVAIKQGDQSKEGD